MLFKIIVIGMLLLIGYSLFSALFHMMKGNKHDTKMVKSLTWRVGLSIFLFLLLMLGFYTGVIVRN
ncbi:MAG: xanthine/uracil permease [Methylophilaceae bacterium]|jgi:xanthine/uracil permease